MVFIHSRGMYHLNIKTTNILLKKHNTAGTLTWDVLPDVKFSDILNQKPNYYTDNKKI